MIARSARTSQSSHDLEAMLREFRCIQSAQEQVTFYGLQRAHLTNPRLNRVAGASGEQGIKHYDVGISTISDNYISDVLINHYDTHEVCAPRDCPALRAHCSVRRSQRYIHQWSEENIVLDIAQADHHGKRFAKMRVDGEQLLNWRCASPPAMPALCCVLISSFQQVHRDEQHRPIGNRCLRRELLLQRCHSCGRA